MSQSTTPNGLNEMKDNLLIPLEMSGTNEPNIGDKQKFTIKKTSIALFVFLFGSFPFYLIILIMDCKSNLQIYFKDYHSFIFIFYYNYNLYYHNEKIKKKN